MTAAEMEDGPEEEKEEKTCFNVNPPQGVPLHQIYAKVNIDMKNLKIVTAN